jgi:hypothetical protein
MRIVYEHDREYNNHCLIWDLFFDRFVLDCIEFERTTSILVVYISFDCRLQAVLTRTRDRH